MKSIRSLATATAFLMAFQTATFAQDIEEDLTDEVTITWIHVLDNRIWIDFTPDIGSKTVCTNKTSVELANEGSSEANPNRDYILSIALTALTTGKTVRWITSNTCSNVDRDFIKGVRIVQ